MKILLIALFLLGCQPSWKVVKEGMVVYQEYGTEHITLYFEDGSFYEIFSQPNQSDFTGRNVEIRESKTSTQFVQGITAKPEK